MSGFWSLQRLWSIDDSADIRYWNSLLQGKSIIGWPLLIIGVVVIIAGILVNLHIYFQPTSLFNTIIMIVLLAGGIGLIFRGLLPHGERSGYSNDNR